MGRNVLNLTKPEPGQIWEHATTTINVLILAIDKTSATCRVLEPTYTVPAQRVTTWQVEIPLSKFRFYGNRGLRLVDMRTGKLPVVLKHCGEYNPRLLNLGATNA